MAKRLANKDNPRLVSLIIERIERIKLPIDSTTQNRNPGHGLITTSPLLQNKTT